MLQVTCYKYGKFFLKTVKSLQYNPENRFLKIRFEDKRDISKINIDVYHHDPETFIKDGVKRGFLDLTELQRG